MNFFGFLTKILLFYITFKNLSHAYATPLSYSELLCIPKQCIPKSSEIPVDHKLGILFCKTITP